jgi:hypothetical protein
MVKCCAIGLGTLRDRHLVLLPLTSIGGKIEAKGVMNRNRLA